MEVIKLKIENPNDRKAVAKQVGDAVAEAIDRIESSKRHMPEEFKTDVDNVDAETLEAISWSEEFKEFQSGLRERVNSLTEYIQSHRKEWNCSFVASVVAISGMESFGGGVAYAGRGDSLKVAMCQLLDDEEFKPLIKYAIAKLKQEELDNEEDTEVETDKA
ncbi:MAG: hypothetical protein HDS77_06995 [Bacteroidales bacterium]|nr:hypothetical protein [Bacteroidales bacterium]